MNIFINVCSRSFEYGAKHNGLLRMRAMFMPVHARWRPNQKARVLLHGSERFCKGFVLLIVNNCELKQSVNTESENVTIR